MCIGAHLNESERRGSFLPEENRRLNKILCVDGRSRIGAVLPFGDFTNCSRPYPTLRTLVPTRLCRSSLSSIVLKSLGSNPHCPQRPRFPAVPNVLHEGKRTTDVLPLPRLPLSLISTAATHRPKHYMRMAQSSYTLACIWLTSLASFVAISIWRCASTRCLISNSSRSLDLVRLSCVASLWSSGFS